MRQLATVVAIGMVAVWWSALGASAPVAFDTVADIKAADASVYQAIMNRDAVRLRDLLDDGFLLTNTFGEVYDRARFLSACCAGAAPSKTLLLGATEMQVRTYAGAAIVVARTEMRFERDGLEERLSWRSTRTYIRAGGKWKLVAEQRTSF